MSMVSTYVLADSGAWYKNPVLGCPGYDYFICFDDDDPIELVIADHSGLSPEQVFKYLGIDAKITSRRSHHSMRVFGNDMRFENARSWWISIEKPIPAKHITESDGIVTEEPFQGVLYDFGLGFGGLK
jgi:hypothetical protein